MLLSTVKKLKFIACRFCISFLNLAIFGRDNCLFSPICNNDLLRVPLNTKFIQNTCIFIQGIVCAIGGTARQSSVLLFVIANPPITLHTRLVINIC